jgi:hypothetical protein
MSVIHLFDAPLTVTRPYEAYFGCLTVPRKVAQTAESHSVVLDWVTPRKTVVELVEATYPGIRREHIHVWTLGGKSREERLHRLWEEWKSLGAHVVEEGWLAPSGLATFRDSGTYAPTFLVRSWSDAEGATHVFLCDGYAATAEAMQAASLSQVLDVDATMSVLSPTFRRAHDDEYRLMKLAEGEYREAIAEARESNIPLDGRVIRADDFMPEKRWRVLACTGYMCDDPYTGSQGIERLADDRYRVTTRLATQDASSRITFTFRLKDGLEEARHVFSPLLVRFMSGVDYTKRPVKISDSGRIRNELQTLISQALSHNGDELCVHFDRIDPKVLAEDKQLVIRQVLEWYKANHPAWFGWLTIRG